MRNFEVSIGVHFKKLLGLHASLLTGKYFAQKPLPPPYFDFFYRNHITQTWAWVILIFRFKSSKSGTHPTWDYVLKILLLSSSFICTRLSDQKISSSPFFQNFTPKNEPGNSYKKNSCKKTVYILACMLQVLTLVMTLRTIRTLCSYHSSTQLYCMKVTFSTLFMVLVMVLPVRGSDSELHTIVRICIYYFWFEKHLLNGFVCCASVSQSASHTFLICKVYVRDVIVYLISHQLALRSC